MQTGRVEQKVQERIKTAPAASTPPRRNSTQYLRGFSPLRPLHSKYPTPHLRTQNSSTALTEDVASYVSTNLPIPPPLFHLFISPSSHSFFRLTPKAHPALAHSRKRLCHPILLAEIRANPCQTDI